MIQMNNKGVTIVEVVVAGAILGLLVLGVFAGIDFMLKSTHKSTVLKTKEAVVENIIESIRANPKLIQAYQETSLEDSPESLLSEDDLPIAWSPVEIVNVEDCGEVCPAGRMGYVSQLVQGAPGLMLITLFIKESLDAPTQRVTFFTGIK